MITLVVIEDTRAFVHSHLVIHLFKAAEVYVWKCLNVIGALNEITETACHDEAAKEPQKPVICQHLE